MQLKLFRFFHSFLLEKMRTGMLIFILSYHFRTAVGGCPLHLCKVPVMEGSGWFKPVGRRPLGTRWMRCALAMLP